jgi:hypothetical protein
VTPAKDTGSTRPLLDKLGVKAGSRVVLLGVDDREFRRLLDDRTDDVHTEPAASTAVELKALADIKLHIKSNGAIWVVRPKGVPGGLNETGIIEAALDAGLVDNKVVSFSPTHSALRLVIPVHLR